MGSHSRNRSANSPTLSSHESIACSTSRMKCTCASPYLGPARSGVDDFFLRLLAAGALLSVSRRYCAHPRMPEADGRFR